MVNTFTWCPIPGAQRARALVVDTMQYGDGYQHIATHGLNPIRDSWAVSFAAPEDTLNDIDAFLLANGAVGFWWTPPAAIAAIYTHCLSWNLSWVDKEGTGDLIGSLQAQFTRSFNVQPGV